MKSTNPMFLADQYADSFVPKDRSQFNPATVEISLPNDHIRRITEGVKEREKDLSFGEAETKAIFLLGLAVGLKYAEVPQRKMDELVERYKRE